MGVPTRLHCSDSHAAKVSDTSSLCPVSLILYPHAHLGNLTHLQYLPSVVPYKHLHRSTCTAWFAPLSRWVSPSSDDPQFISCSRLLYSFIQRLHAALASILSCRLLLRLRIAYNAPETTVGNSSTLSEWIARGTSLHVPAAVPSPSPLDHGHNRIVRTNILAPGRRCSPNTETIELVTFAKPG